jgi:hypothetical protein
MKMELLFLGLLACISLGAKDWPPIPAEVWAMKAMPGGKGAVVLDEWIRYGTKDTEVRMRVRIFGEEGKGVAALPGFSHAWTLEGRTEQPDGTVTPFNDVKDLVKQTKRVGNEEIQRQSLIPPGLTSDCVVDLHYSIESKLMGDWVEILVQGAFPVRKKVMEMTTKSRLGSVFLSRRGLLYERTSNAISDIYTFKDLPGEDREPFSVPDLWATRFLYFSQLGGTRFVQTRGPEAYWKYIIEAWYKPGYTRDLSFGSTYRDWSKALRTGLEGDAPARAAAILVRLEREIQNGSKLTQAEFDALGKKSAEEGMRYNDLDAAVKRRRTSDIGMHCLFFQLLVDEGLEPKLLLVANRNVGPFQYQLPVQSQITNVLLGVANKDGLLTWFDPFTRFLPAGIVVPAFQETEGLLVETRDWTFRPFKLAHQTADVNVSRYEYALDLGESLEFTEHASFRGYAEHQERLCYYGMDALVQEKALKEAVEGRDKTLTVAHTRVEHALESGIPLTWALDGAGPLEGGRRKVFSPFPGLPSPMLIPDSWPQARTLSIVLPFCFRWSAVSRFKVPEGWTLARDPDLAKANSFGKVTWKVEESVVDGKGGAVVTFTVDLETMAADAAREAALRQFLSWIESASRRTLQLERL